MGYPARRPSEVTLGEHFSARSGRVMLGVDSAQQHIFWCRCVVHSCTLHTIALVRLVRLCPQRVQWTAACQPARIPEVLWEKRRCPRPVRVHFFGFYRAVRVQFASTSVSPSAPQVTVHKGHAGVRECYTRLFRMPRGGWRGVRRGCRTKQYKVRRGCRTKQYKVRSLHLDAVYGPQTMRCIEVLRLAFQRVADRSHLLPRRAVRCVPLQGFCAPRVGAQTARCVQRKLAEGGLSRLRHTPTRGALQHTEQSRVTLMRTVLHSPVDMHRASEAHPDQLRPAEVGGDDGFVWAAVTPRRDGGAAHLTHTGLGADTKHAADAPLAAGALLVTQTG
eukprot:gene23521-biopygen5830